MTDTSSHTDAIRKAAETIAEADALLITAGAGMSVDSGLPDFRSKEGLWRAYPPLRKLGLAFEQMAQPHWFQSAPEMAWAWYGHRRTLYDAATPHAGYALLRDWGASLKSGCFVITSNVDGQFARARFDPARILEVHGSIHRLQCTAPCSAIVWQDNPPDLKIDMASLRAQGRLPRCPECSALARPNVLMFDDTTWVDAVKERQLERFTAWLQGVSSQRLVVLECGAGMGVPTIRNISARIAGMPSATLVRINPEPDGADATEAEVSIRLTALEALDAIHRALPADFHRRREPAPAPAPKSSWETFSRLVEERVKNAPGEVLTSLPGDHLRTMKDRRIFSKAWQVRLPSGWVAWVDQLHVIRMYLGTLAGLPSRASVDIEIQQGVEFVRKNFGGPEPVVIPPKVFDAASDTPILPPLRFAAQIATFDSYGTGDGTWMNLVWFADIDDDKSIKAFVEEALARVDWRRQATPYEI